MSSSNIHNYKSSNYGSPHSVPDQKSLPPTKRPLGKNIEALQQRFLSLQQQEPTKQFQKKVIGNVQESPPNSTKGHNINTNSPRLSSKVAAMKEKFEPQQTQSPSAGPRQSQPTPFQASLTARISGLAGASGSTASKISQPTQKPVQSINLEEYKKKQKLIDDDSKPKIAQYHMLLSEMIKAKGRMKLAVQKDGDIKFIKPKFFQRSTEKKALETLFTEIYDAIEKGFTHYQVPKISDPSKFEIKALAPLVLGFLNTPYIKDRILHNRQFAEKIIFLQLNVIKKYDRKLYDDLNAELKKLNTNNFNGKKTLDFIIKLNIKVEQLLPSLRLRAQEKIGEVHKGFKNVGDNLTYEKILNEITETQKTDFPILNGWWKIIHFLKSYLIKN